MRMNKQVAPDLLSQEEWKELTTNRISFGEGRLNQIMKTSWGILTKETAKVLIELIKGKRVMEVASGNGYMAANLRRMAGMTRQQYRAYDNCSSHHWGTRPWYAGTRMNALRANFDWPEVVILSWPDLSGNFSHRVLRKMKAGQMFIFQGESCGGCTGTIEFHDILNDEFTLLEEVSDDLNESHVNYYGINDYWWVYVKN
ncbi:hypothetical protein [Pseudomonas aeruginosa]|uniref:hypothetical protein n=1 Tax=Pseudomonas aeruginosa TaxID=287 RepID=UPI003FD29E69